MASARLSVCRPEPARGLRARRRNVCMYDVCIYVCVHIRIYIYICMYIYIYERRLLFMMKT